MGCTCFFHARRFVAIPASGVVGCANHHKGIKTMHLLSSHCQPAMCMFYNALCRLSCAHSTFNCSISIVTGYINFCYFSLPQFGGFTIFQSKWNGHMGRLRAVPMACVRRRLAEATATIVIACKQLNNSPPRCFTHKKPRSEREKKAASFTNAAYNSYGC